MNRPIQKLLIANRGEIAVRIARTASAMGIATVTVYSDEDTASMHVGAADEAVALAKAGAAAYLDIMGIVAVAIGNGCDAIHPGYGFLSENVELARHCRKAGIRFVGPDEEALALFGDKLSARALAQKLGVPVLAGTSGPTSLEEARAFMESLGNGAAIMVKAVAGGGGRGMRPVHRIEELDDAFARCQSEALGAFGRADVYLERLVTRARHIEVQIVGDGSGNVSHLWDRDCSLQRRNQKLVEIAPAYGLDPSLRGSLLDAALKLAGAVKYRNLGTFEFLVDADSNGNEGFSFMEANPRLQVEHTVTEAVTGLDLVEIQLEIAAGATLGELRLLQENVRAANGTAVQLRINMESMKPDGTTLPASGTLDEFQPPCGVGIRVDSFGFPGYRTTTSFDSLLAKLVVHAPRSGLSQAINRARRSLDEFRITGVRTNIAFLAALLRRPEVLEGKVSTRFVETHLLELVSATDDLDTEPSTQNVEDSSSAVEDVLFLHAALPGRVVAVMAEMGSEVAAGQVLAVLEAMKMEHEIKAPCSGIVHRALVQTGDSVMERQKVFVLIPSEVQGNQGASEAEWSPDQLRSDLGEVLRRRDALQDRSRPEAVAKRRHSGQRTARENLSALFDDGAYTEYGEFAVAGQRGRRSIDELERLSPADGLVAGIGCVNAESFGDEARCIGMAYDYTVFAGTQGLFNHAKKDRMLELASRWRIPVTLFAEGGGGRPGDTDWEYVVASALAVPTFSHYAGLSGFVPLVGIASGRCFAGNAALLGCSDVIIATRNSNIGMGGPAMIEAAGLGTFKPEDVGPVGVQTANGVIDVLVDDEPQAAETARRYLSYFQGQLSTWSCEDQRKLRQLIPENRLRAYDIRLVIATLADSGSILELRRDFGLGIVTVLVRMEGRPFGLIANNPMHLGGAIDADAADKGARFLQLCDAFDIPLISLCDTPGFMVGPDAEKGAQVRHVSRLFVAAASLTVPFFTVVLRKAYGLGAQAMSGGGFHASFFTVSWPSGELGPMGLEGGVRLGYRKELKAAGTPAARKALFDDLVKKAYSSGKALNVASYLEIDSVIDPRDTREWILRGIRSTPPAVDRKIKKRPFVDTW